MKVLLRLKEVDVEIAADLANAHCGGSFAPKGAEDLWLFVDLKSIQYDENGEGTIDLRISERFMPDLPDKEMPRNSVGEKEEQDVTREMLDPLWDLLEIFPRSDKVTELPSMTKVEVLPSLRSVLLKNGISSRYVEYDALCTGLVQWAADMCRQSRKSTI